VGDKTFGWAIQVISKAAAPPNRFVCGQALGINSLSHGKNVLWNSSWRAVDQAHACGGGKCIAVGKVARTGQPKAGGSEYLKLHEAFSIGLRAPGETPSAGLVSALAERAELLVVEALQVSP